MKNKQIETPIELLEKLDKCRNSLLEIVKQEEIIKSLGFIINIQIEININ